MYYGSEFVAKAVRKWIAAVGAKTAYIEPGSLGENGYIESFNARFRDELLNGEIFYSLKEAQIVIEQWRQHYNTGRRYPEPSSRCTKGSHALTYIQNQSVGAGHPLFLRA